MQYIHKIDFDAMAASGADQRWVQHLLDAQTGAGSCMVRCIKTPGGGGSPAGLHTHDVDQIFYILSGAMGVEIEGERYDCGPGALIFFPAGIAHRNWNIGEEPTVHLALNPPLTDPNAAFAKPV